MSFAGVGKSSATLSPCAGLWVLIIAPFCCAQESAPSVLTERFVFASIDADAAAEAQSAAEQPEPVGLDPKTDDDVDSVPPSWVDNSHGYVVERANTLTRWVDSYFGDTETDQEGANSLLRLRLINDWDQRFGNEFKVRVGGKVNLPAVSRRLDLVFRGDDPADEINGQQDQAQSEIGLQYKLGERHSNRHRFDVTLGLDSSGPSPGLKYRFQGNPSEKSSVRFTQRLQYEIDDGLNATSRLDVDRQLSESSLLRSYSRVFVGEDSLGTEWSTSLSYITFWNQGAKRQHGLATHAATLYAEVSGVTDPSSYISNYRIGTRLRRQTYRDYLFLELEPSYNWRIDEPGLPRRGALRLEVRFEFLLFDYLRRDDEALARR